VKTAGKKAGKRHFVYGPVPSRRLGFSLGVDILPYKTCSLDCLYCQLGRSGRTTTRRRAYFSVREVLAKVRKALTSARRVDHITFSGSGEPTLNKNLGPIIRGLKKMTRVPIAVLTNGTLLTRKDVRADLMEADIVAPSLDAVPPVMFRRVNRPHSSLDSGRIVDGLARFRREFKGLIWLEVMLVNGVNDTAAGIRELKKAAAAINPDRIQLNTVVRPPADASAAPLPVRKLEKIRAALGERAEVVADFGGKRRPRKRGGLEETIAAMVGRRPVTVGDLSVSLGRRPAEVVKALGRMLKAGRIRAVAHGRKTFYRPA